ncbi:MAG: DUF222 domain-containing protein [Chloroflexi bacterium]|nr:MAG: DUF222 domain-containing protein [Chloroflexota bacterium]
MVVEEATRPLSPEVTALLGAIERFRQRPSAHREPAELAAELKAVRHGQDLLDLEFSKIAALFQETQEYEDQGSVSPFDWIRHHCRMSSSAVWSNIAVGQHLDELPGSVSAVENGEIGFSHLALMARTAEVLAGSETAAPFEETELLEKAREFSVGRLWHFCHHLRHASDPEGFAAQQNRATEARSLKLSPCEDGTLLLEGWLDTIGGGALRSALEPLALPHGDHDDRCRERRYADALVEVITHAQDMGSLPQRPHLQVTASLDTLRGEPGSPAGDMEYSLPVSAATVQRLACDGTITRVVFGPESVVIDVGRARRVVAGPTRRALNARDGHCKWPRCDRPASWSDAHHVIHWTKGGETDLSNMVLLCHRHHWMAHEGGWQLVRTDEGEVLAVPPRPPGLARAADVPDQVEAARRFVDQFAGDRVMGAG